ncbi:MAG: CotH kinase family protein [Bacteroidales bacterium]|nr:CotH kinase family protein [Bacteroidales bacterium]
MVKRFKLILPLLAVLFLVHACAEDIIEVVDDPDPEEQPQEQGSDVKPEDPPAEKPDTTEIKLTGEIIGTEKCVDYSSGEATYSKNTRQNVFDGNYDTYFATYTRSGTWVGLDLGEKHVITRVGYSPRISQEGRVQLAVIEGANSIDFSDALPLGIIKEKGISRQMQYIDVHCSRGFRYVRYVGPNDARCNLAELEFYGWKGEGDDSLFCQLTNLPTVIINTQHAREITSRTTYVTSNVSIISNGGRKILETAETGVRGRGNASWGFPKKPYKIKFAEKHTVPGSPTSDKKWTLINNYGDKTLMRNILAFEVSRRAGMAYTPFCTPVDLILNGEYEGCYQLCDQVESGEGRVPAKGGFFIEIDAYAYSEPVYFYSAKGIPVTVKHPDNDKITAGELSFIKNYFSQMETAMFGNNYKDPGKGYRKYLDLDSFLRNFIIGEFCGNTDTYWSVNMYKDGANGPFFTGPAWDYDLAFENDNRTYPINSINDYIYASKGSVAADAVRTMVNRIVKQDPDARARLVEIWDEAKPSLQDLNDYVDRTAALLDESQQLNFIRWPILNTYVHQNPNTYGSYAGEVDAVKKYITRRLTRFDELVRKYNQ